jgi:hypothetical protein
MQNIVPLCSWLFQEPSGSPRVSDGQYSYALQEMNGPIVRINDGIVGPGQWFNLSILDSAEQICGHLSSTDVPSPEHQYCMAAAIEKNSCLVGGMASDCCHF